MITTLSHDIDDDVDAGIVGYIWLDELLPDPHKVQLEIFFNTLRKKRKEPEDLTLEGAIDTAEKNALLYWIAAHRSEKDHSVNLTRVAKSLGINRNTVYTLLNRHGIHVRAAEPQKTD
ncbi:MAG: hypothetical protein KBD00_01710 [Candidatus Peribacteraceae bacterium]|nr:hypothetical protein [Candidatus Peribacteraceae bacterium]